MTLALPNWFTKKKTATSPAALTDIAPTLDQAEADLLAAEQRTRAAEARVQSERSVQAFESLDQAQIEERRIRKMVEVIRSDVEQAKQRESDAQRAVAVKEFDALVAELSSVDAVAVRLIDREHAAWLKLIEERAARHDHARAMHAKLERLEKLRVILDAPKPTTLRNIEPPSGHRIAEKLRWSKAPACVRDFAQQIINVLSNPGWSG